MEIERIVDVVAGPGQVREERVLAQRAGGDRGAPLADLQEPPRVFAQVVADGADSDED